jgi:hypothetical protein
VEGKLEIEELHEDGEDEEDEENSEDENDEDDEEKDWENEDVSELGDEHCFHFTSHLRIASEFLYVKKEGTDSVLGFVDGSMDAAASCKWYSGVPGALLRSFWNFSA